MNAENKSLYIDQIQTDVSLISFLTVISVFFIGALLPNFNSYDLSIKIPLSFLLISTFGFLFSALILSNTSQKIVKGEFDKVEKHLQYGYSISEYIGIYLFVLSLPLIVNIITTDLYLRVVTFLSAVVGMGFYQFMGFSLLENYFSKTHKIFSILTILFSVILFASQIYAFHFVIISISFLFFILLTAYLAPQKKFQ